MIRDLRCWLGRHQLVHYLWWSGEWTCRCRKRVESSRSRIFGDQAVKW